MARLSRDSNLETRTARARLKQRHEPYWRQIHPGLAIGYRKGKRGGVWVARCATESGYSHTRLGKADDHADPNGIDVLSYKEAHRKAIGSADQVAAQESQGIDADYTVADCMRDYLEWFKVEKAIEGTLDAGAGGLTRQAIKDSVIRRFDINEVRRFNAVNFEKNFTVVKKGQRVTISAHYDAEESLFYNIFVVVKFEGSYSN